MKGLTLNNIIQSKTYYIVTLIGFAVFALLEAILLNVKIEGDLGVITVIGALSPLFGPLFIVCALLDSYPKVLAREINSGFLNYSLTTGVSKTAYAMHITVTHIIYAVISWVLSIILFLIADSALKGFYGIAVAEFIKWSAVIIFAFSAMDCFICLVTLYLKDSEKAGMAVGFPLGIVLGILTTTVFDGETNISISDYMTDTNLLICFVAIIVLIAISTLLTIRKLKRGV